MNRSMRVRLAALATVSLVALAAGGAASAERFEPFVTDFPRVTTPVEPFRPFATDFGIAPRPAGEGLTLPAGPSQPSTGRAWGDVALGSGLGIAFAALVSVAALAFRAGRLRGARRHGVFEPQAAPPR